LIYAKFCLLYIKKRFLFGWFVAYIFPTIRWREKLSLITKKAGAVGYLIKANIRRVWVKAFPLKISPWVNGWVPGNLNFSLLRRSGTLADNHQSICTNRQHHRQGLPGSRPRQCLTLLFQAISHTDAPEWVAKNI